MEANRQKKSEWNAIENLIPIINKKLRINISVYDKQYEAEMPDFIFKNEKGYTIGVEVVECHPSVNINKKRNAGERNTFKNRVCNILQKSSFLESKTKEQKLNIFIDRYNFSNERELSKDKVKLTPEAFAKEVEVYLNNMFNGFTYPTKHIKRIKIWETRGKNIVQFNSIARRDSVSWQDLEKCIDSKNRKYSIYQKKHKCDEYWLCIYLPFEENKHPYDLDYKLLSENAKQKVDSSPFKCIVVTSVMPIDLAILKD